MLPAWAAILIALIGSGGFAALITWLLNRKFNEERDKQAHIDVEKALDEALLEPRAQAKKWFDMWKEEADARAADRVGFIVKMTALETRINILVARLAAAGLPTNGV